MDIRKIALGIIAAGAALAFAPVASADDLTTIVDSEISSLNSIFESEAAVAGDSADVVSSSGLLDTIPLADAPDAAPFTTLSYELYGLLPGLLDTTDATPGAYDVFNGALTEFYDASNALLYMGLDDGAVIPTTDLLGAADIALDDGTITDAGLFANFFDTGVNELLGYFGAVWLA
jgi:hypothetical protein